MTKNTNHDELFETLLKLKSIEDFRKFFADLCTMKELDAMTQRIITAKLLLSGETFEKIVEKTETETAIELDSRFLEQGDKPKVQDPLR